jgi:hypothetical protein
MPDHLHALIQIPERSKLTHVIASWKGYLARNLSIRWHRGFFDHRIRRSESLNEKWNYIVMNPVRSGFVKKPEEWLHRWAPEGADDLGRARRSSVPQALHFKTLSPSGGTDDRPGHPRTSGTLVRTNAPPSGKKSP